jgi:putative AlgH/UPF0301 family transcriptional regulator
MLVGLNMAASSVHFATKGKRFIGDIEVLDEQVLHQQGSFKRVKRWLRGKHPQLGILHLGYTGWETIQEVDVISPMVVFEVIDA